MNNNSLKVAPVYGAVQTVRGLIVEIRPGTTEGAEYLYEYFRKNPQYNAVKAQGPIHPRKYEPEFTRKDGYLVKNT